MTQQQGWCGGIAASEKRRLEMDGRARPGFAARDQTQELAGP